MKLPRLRIVVLVAAIIGILVPPVLLLLAYWTHSSLLVDRAMVLLWPTCALLMATEGHEHSFNGYLVLVGVIASNAVLYIIGFTAVWCVGWVMRAWRRSRRDGTTT